MVKQVIRAERSEAATLKAVLKVPLGLHRYHDRVRAFQARWLEDNVPRDRAWCKRVRPVWSELVADTWRAQHLLKSGAALTAPHVAAAPDTALPSLEGWERVSRGLLTLGYREDKVRRVEAAVADSGYDAERLLDVKTVGELQQLLVEHSVNFGNVVRDKWLTAHGPVSYAKAATCEDVDVEINGKNCNESEDPRACKETGQTLVFVIIVVAIAGGIASILESIFGDDTDDKIRAKVKKSPCAVIAAKSDQEITDWLFALIDGFCGDDDENAILKILYCLDCERTAKILKANIGAGGLMDAFDGSQWDLLMLRLHNCGLVAFADFDDDATRLFVDKATCALINGLTMDEIRQLMLNLFSGPTLDEDEAAIIKIVSCLPCDKIIQLVGMPDMSMEDFDDEVDGTEWDELSNLFWKAIVSCFP